MDILKMGVETWYVAIPAETEVLKRAQTDAEFGEYLGMPWIFGKAGVGCNSWDQAGEEFCSQIQQLNQAHPGLNQRVYTLDRWFDKLHYLLSEDRRRGHYNYEDWATQAILGAKELSEHLKGGQGHPVRYSPPDVVQNIAVRCQEVTILELRDTYDPAAMQQQAVYKSSAHDDPDGWQLIYSYFSEFKSFYLEVATHQEGVLVVIT